MSTDKNSEAAKSVTVGAGTDWERQRVQSVTPDAIAAREQVQQGAELTRVVSRIDQAADGAQPWTLTPRESIEQMGVEDFNRTYGVAGQYEKNAAPLDPAMVVTGRMPADGNFVTAEALQAYHSDAKLESAEVVAAPDTVVTTGAYELYRNPSLGSFYPPDLKTLQASGSLPQCAPPENEVQHELNQPIQDAMPSISNEPSKQPEPSAPLPADSSNPPAPPDDLSKESFGPGPQQVRDDVLQQNSQPSALACEMSAAHGHSPNSQPAPSNGPDSPSR